MLICIAPCHEHTSRVLRYGTRLNRFHLHTQHSSANGMNHACLFLPSQTWSSFTDSKEMEGWVGLGGWLHTEINVRHRELNPDMITYLSTNQAWRRLTSLIKTNARPLHYDRKWWQWLIIIIIIIIIIRAFVQLHKVRRYRGDGKIQTSWLVTWLASAVPASNHIAPRLSLSEWSKIVHNCMEVAKILFIYVLHRSVYCINI